MNDKNDNKKSNKFSSAMGDLKGLLDKEGINLSFESDSEATPDNPLHTVDSPSDILNIQIPSLSEEIKKDNVSSTLEIDIPLISNEVPQPKLPTLNGTITVVDEIDSDSMPKSDLDDYISDFDEDKNELLGFANTIEELEEKVEAITDPEHLQLFEQNEAQNIQLRHLKASFHKNLAHEIETSIETMKSKLLESMESEINDLFNRLSKK